MRFPIFIVYYYITTTGVCQGGKHGCFLRKKNSWLENERKIMMIWRGRQFFGDKKTSICSANYDRNKSPQKGIPPKMAQYQALKTIPDAKKVKLFSKTCAKIEKYLLTIYFYCDIIRQVVNSRSMSHCGKILYACEIFNGRVDV